MLSRREVGALKASYDYNGVIPHEGLTSSNFPAHPKPLNYTHCQFPNMVDQNIELPGMSRYNLDMTIRPKTPKRSRKPNTCVQPANVAGASTGIKSTRQKRARSEQAESSSAPVKHRKRDRPSNDTLHVDTSAIAGSSSAPDPFSTVTPPTPNGLQLNVGEMPRRFPASFGVNDVMYQSWMESQHPSMQYEQPLMMPIGGYGSSYSPSTYSHSTPGTPTGSFYAASPGAFTPSLTPDVGTPHCGHGHSASSPYTPSNYGVIPLPQAPIPSHAVPPQQAPPSHQYQPQPFVPPQPAPSDSQSSETYQIKTTTRPMRVIYEEVEYYLIPCSTMLNYAVIDPAQPTTTTENTTGISSVHIQEEAEISISPPSPFPQDDTWEADCNLAVQTGPPVMIQEYPDVVQMKSRSRCSSYLHQSHVQQNANVRLAQATYSAPMPIRPLPALEMEPMASFAPDPSFDALPTPAQVDQLLANDSSIYASATTAEVPQMYATPGPLASRQYVMQPDGNFNFQSPAPQPQSAVFNPTTCSRLDTIQYLQSPQAMYPTSSTSSKLSSSSPADWGFSEIPDTVHMFADPPVKAPGIHQADAHQDMPPYPNAEWSMDF